MKKNKNEKNYYNEIERILSLIPHRYQVKFALYCAENVFHLLEPKDKEAIRHTLDLVQDWINGKSVSKKDLDAAANAAYAAYAANAAYAAYSAYSANAAYAAYSANAAANAAAYAANAAYSAANAAAYAAANAAAYVADNDYKSYYEELLRIVKEITPFERLGYNITKEPKELK